MPASGKDDKGKRGATDERRPRRRERGDGDRSDRGRAPRVVSRRRYEKPDDAIEAVIQRYGSRDKAIEALLGQTYELREDRRELEEELEELEGKVPADDSLVLSGDDKKKWEAIKGIDLPGEKIAERVKKAEELETKDTKRELSTKRKAVATNAGFNGDVLDPLLDQFGLEVELRPVTIMNGDKSETKQVAHVRKAGEKDAAWEKLSDFAGKDGSPLKPFAAALKTTSGSSSSQQTGTTGTTKQNAGGGIEFPPSGGGSNNGATSGPLDDILGQNKSRANRANPISARQAPAAETAKT